MLSTESAVSLTVLIAGNWAAKDNCKALIYKSKDRLITANFGLLSTSSLQYY
ncbi:MAG: hypothetical protein OFPII_01260 [Osedax symbiont Rs1]|nr:MAG: hypothetical protein OFPII_01260 [Osedax symbiont Rs1]